MSYGIGTIGLGSIGRRMLAAVAEHPRIVTVSGWDPDPTARARAALSGIPVASGPRDLIDDPRVDVVYVACPPRHHAEHVIAAVEAGKAILCEKPLGVDLDASEALTARVESSGVAAAVNLLFGSARSGMTIAAALGDGTLGEPVWVEVRLHLPRWARRRVAEAPWLGAREQGGFVREVSTHYVYLCQRLLGPLELRHATVIGSGQSGGAERFATYELDAGGVPVTVTGSIDGTGPEVNELIVWGTASAYRIRELHSVDVATEKGWAPVYPPPPDPERDTHLRQLDGLARLLDGQPSGLADFRAALEVQAVVEAVLANRR